MSSFQTLIDAVASSFALKLAITVSLLLLYPIGVFVRNIYFHPLSKFPGPKLWAASYIPYIKALLTGTLVKEHAEIHDKYGDVVRVGPNEISFATDEAWRDIYEYRPGHKETSKDPVWYIAPNGAPQNIVTTTDAKVHARMRKYLGNSFTDTALIDQRPTIEGYADLFISRLRDMSTAPETGGKGALVDMTDWINFFTVDVIGDLAFGEPFGCLQTSDYHPWVRTLFNFLKGMVFAASTRFYPWIASAMESLLPKSVMDLQRQHTEFANEKINRRLNLQTNRPDFMTPFLKQNPDFKYMSKGEIESTFAIIIVAGSETSATVLCGILNQLTKNSNSLMTLENVIRQRFRSEEEISIETTTNIPYLEAVIHEGLRLCNPVPGGLPRVVPQGGETYAGYFLPGGTKLSIRPYVLNRSKKHFAAPYEFCPKRWMPTDQRPSKFANDSLSVSKPFSTGPTGCLGKSLAWAEMRLILARLVWAFNISVDPDRAVDWTKLRAMMTIEKQPMLVRLKIRPM
ncbi:hypothetical protein QQS21_003905 [Conoideocrella luteorostrata]|uniref:Cytochrome P450 n=1 Tax=Conoideocrella luteorostrata TaxID=1105319 RepID=A0AAJ0CTB3_9HYPO|nr:hypothetical protein QQS21_003905 [Conoideocrella luteorostrata]